jgi:hypothetical protein
MTFSNAQILTLWLQVLAFQKEYEALNGYINDRPGQNLVAPYPHPHSPRSSPTTANPSAWDKIREKVLLRCLQTWFFVVISLTICPRAKQAQSVPVCVCETGTVCASVRNC